MALLPSLPNRVGNTLSNALPNALGKKLDNARAWVRRDKSFILSERTPYSVIANDAPASLRYYPPLESSHIRLENEQLSVRRETRQTPVVIVSPLAVNMSLYDLFPERSFVRYLLASGFPVYLVDWGTPDRRHDTLNMADYFAERLPAFLRAVRQHSGHQNLSLHGWSFGGLFSYAYTALTRDPHIRNLVLVGAPCDYHANGTLGKQYQRLSHTMNWLNQRTRFRVHNTPPGLWRASGMSNALAFKLTSPAASINSYIKLLKQLDDTDYVVQHATNSAFLDQMVAYPGACIQDIVQYLLTENLLARGRLPLPNRPALLADIDASILMITGNQDTVITRNCSHALLKQVCSKDITTQEINGGHMSIVGGPEAARESWPFIVNWLAARDAQAQSATDRKRRVTAK